MKKSHSASPAAGRRASSREERGDPSDRCLKRTILLCALGIAVVLFYSLSPRKASPSGPAQSSTASKSPASSFDHRSIGTKGR